MVFHDKIRSFGAVASQRTTETVQDERWGPPWIPEGPGDDDAKSNKPPVRWLKADLNNGMLVVWNMAFIFHDELRFFKMVKTTNQMGCEIHRFQLVIRISLAHPPKTSSYNKS